MFRRTGLLGVVCGLLAVGFVGGTAVGFRLAEGEAAGEETAVASPEAVRVYENVLTPLEDAAPLLADYPEYV
ncbi:MAG: hypothetical protein DWQ34_10475, partial [Planctomycetota bacterium]